MKAEYKVIAASLALGLLFWFFDAFMDCFFFSEKPFLALLIYDIPSHDLFMRITSFVCLLLFGTVLSIAIAQRVKLSANLNEAKHRFKAFMETASDLMHITDKEGNITYVNHAMAMTLGYSKQELMGMHITQLMSKNFAYSTRETFDQKQKELALKGSFRTEPIWVTKDGREILGDANVVVIYDGKGRYAGSRGVFRDVTERRQAADKLRATSDKLNATLDALPDLLFEVDRKGRILDYRAPGPESLYTKPSGFLGKKVTNVLPPNVAQIVMNTIDEAVKAGRSNGAIYQLEINGSSHWYELSAATQGDPTIPEGCIIVLVREITDRKLTEDSLKQGEARYRELFDNISSGVAVYEAVDDGADFVFKDFNKTGACIEKVNKKDIIGKRLTEAFPNVEEFGLLEVLRKVWKTGKSENHSTSLYNDNRIKGWRENHVYRLPTGEIVAVYDDVTEQKKAEEESALLNKQLVQADKMASLGILVSGMAHEINNPNQFIMSHITPLRKSWEDAMPILERYYEENGDFAIGGGRYSGRREQISAMFSSIEKGSSRIKAIVNELRDYAREYPADRKETICINNVVKSALTLLNQHVKKSTNNFSLNLQEDIPTLLGNYQRLEQVAINLIQNACQALDKAAAGITVSTYYDEKDENVVLEIVDEGVGIKDADLPHLTDPFFTTKRTAGGTGLGLSISSSIVTNHGGTMSFRGASGKGTKAVVSFPISGKDAPHV